MANVFWAFITCVAVGVFQLFVLDKVVNDMTDTVKVTVYAINGGITGLVFVITRWFLCKRSKDAE